MSFKLIHTADWHIAKPFGGFGTDVSVLLREARLEVLDAVAAEARMFGAAHIVVAGDVLDSPGVADEVIARTLARLAKHDTLRWHLLSGNHDPAVAGGVWDRIVRYGVPDNVTTHLAAAPCHLTPDVVLLPAPLATRHTATDPTRWMDEAITPEGVLRIGLAHGAVQGFDSDAAASVPLAIDRATTAGLAYLALGDWHGAREVAPRTWYSGTPEPDRYLDNGPGHVLAVEVLGASAVAVTPRRVSKHTWLRRIVDVTVGDPLAGIEAEIAALGAASDRALVQVTLRGAVTIGEDQILRARLAGLQPRLLHLEARLDDLAISATADGAGVDFDPALAAIAQNLAARLACAETPRDAAVLRQALRRLSELARSAAEPVANSAAENELRARGGRAAA